MKNHQRQLKNPAGDDDGRGENVIKLTWRHGVTGIRYLLSWKKKKKRRWKAWKISKYPRAAAARRMRKEEKSNITALYKRAKSENIKRWKKIAKSNGENIGGGGR